MGHLRVSASLLLAASLLSSLAQAAPARRALEARDYVTHIVTETVWTTVDITTTIYVDELPLTPAPASASAEMTVSPEEDTSSAVATSSSAPIPTSDAPAPAPEPVSTEPPSSEEAPAPSTAAGEFAESSAPPAPVYTPAEPPVPADSAPAPAPPASSEAPAPAPAPAPVDQTADNYDSSGSSSGGSESATCEGGSSSCKGDITYYEGGLGACGTTVDTESEMAIALPYEFMGTASNSNPYCGKTVTVKNPVSGTTVQGTIKDKCMGCVGRSIDLTSKMFNAVTDGKGDGRVKNIEWWIN